MKRLALLSLFSLMITSLALSDGLFSFGVHGSFANLDVAEPLHRAYSSGFGGGLHGDFHFGFATLRVSGDYISFGADHDVYTTLIYNAILADYPDFLRQEVQVDGGGTVSVISFGVNGKFNFPGPVVSPYAIVGIGTAILNITQINATIQGAPATIVSDLTDQTKLAANVGAGIDFPIGTKTLFLEARYTWVFTDNKKSAYIPVTLGVTF